MGKLSIITVCFNCEKDVSYTLESLLHQTYQDFEYIVIDGGSSDKTVSLIQKMTSSLANVKIISEKDRGIYDAMNKGVSLATGDFVYFLNIGDKLVNDSTLEEMISHLKDNNTLYYGDFVTSDKTIIQPDTLTDFFFLREKMICHQSIFSPREFLEEYPFDLSYSCCSDRDWLLHLYKECDVKFCHVALPIAVYDTTGFSSDKEKVLSESKLILKKYYPDFLIPLVKFKNIMGRIIPH